MSNHQCAHGSDGSDHICHFYEKEEQKISQAASFFSQGFEENDVVFWVEGKEENRKRVFQILENRGFDVQKLIAEERFLIRSAKDSYNDGGSFKKEEMMGILSNLAKKTQERGFNRLRTTGDSSWVRLDNSEEVAELFLYESGITDWIAKKVPCISLCQYSTQDYDAAYLHEALITHPRICVESDTTFFDNLCHVTPSQYVQDGTSHPLLKKLYPMIFNIGHKDHCKPSTRKKKKSRKRRNKAKTSERIPQEPSSPNSNEPKSPEIPTASPSLSASEQSDETSSEISDEITDESGGKNEKKGEYDEESLKIEKLRRKNRKKRNKNNMMAKMKLLATMSHEIRTPLHGIVGMTEVMLNRREEISTENSESLQLISTSGKHLLALVGDVLDWVRLENDRVQLEHLPLSILNCVEEAWAICKPQGVLRGLTLEETYSEFSSILPQEKLKTISFEESSPETSKEKSMIKSDWWIKGDRVRLRQVLVNLLGNAVKFSDQGGKVKVQVEKEILDPEHGCFTFRVSDEGIGIPPDKAETIFEEFSQADQSTSRLYGGTGLGLSISKQIVEIWGGKMWVKSTLGEGATFNFTLPAQFLSVSSEGEEVGPENLPDLSKLEILVVEDNATNQKVMRHMLKQLNCRQFEMVSNGQEAVDRAANRHFDLILMDLHMPVCDGWKATKMIKSFPPEAQPRRIVALTASYKHENEQDHDPSLFDNFLSKPLGLHILREELTKLASF